MVFTDPEIAWCGLTESEAERGRSASRRSPSSRGRRSAARMTLDRTDGLTKLIVDPETGRVLGVGIVGAGRRRADRRGRAGHRDGRHGARTWR